MRGLKRGLLAIALLGCSAGTLETEDANSLGAGTDDGPATTTALPQTTSDSQTSTTRTATGDDTTGEGATTAAEASETTRGESGSSTTGAELPVLASCADLLSFQPGLPSAVYTIDPDGPGEVSGLEVFCEMELSGGGWTLVMVSSDDDTHTWTYAARTLMTTNETSVGDVDERDRDYKSLALHRLPVNDLLFLHAPSDVWAAYEDIGAGGADFGTFMASLDSPNCLATLPGNGLPMTDGTLTVKGNLCDTDLYFHVGDWDGGEVTACEDATRGYNNTTYGPTWNQAANGGCPFDDPVNSALGPSIQCVDCDPGTEDTEVAGVGFGGPAMLNTGMPGAAENYMQVFVR